MNADKNISEYMTGEPWGQRNNAIRWLQKKIAQQAATLPYHFNSLGEWTAFRDRIRDELPGLIGIPDMPGMEKPVVRARILVSGDTLCERVDIPMDEDYMMPALVFSPAKPASLPLRGLVWNPGWPQSKWEPAYQAFAVRMARHGFVTVVPDHAPFGETGTFEFRKQDPMTQVMGMGHLLGISQLALRAAETMRAGEYLRARPDVDEKRVALSGLCQGGMDTWLTAALDDRFCAAAPMCSASTFAIHMVEMASYFANADASPFPLSILKLCDVDHLHACIAPRPLMVRANLPDQWWPISGYDAIESFTRKIYHLYDAVDKLDFMAEVHEHNLTGPFADALEHFLLKYV